VLAPSSTSPSALMALMPSASAVPAHNTSQHSPQ
jgi:hypothetical protein